MNKAAFIDRDGVINKMIYHRDHGLIDSPFTASQFELLPGVIPALNDLWHLGYKLIIVSNQPGIAKGHFTMDTFRKIREKMQDIFHRNQIKITDEYYCLHHPDAVIPEYKKNCNCRKPDPGLLLQAAEDHNVNLEESWMIGDGVTDIQAGDRAGTKTAFVGKEKCYYCKKFDEVDVEPDLVASSLSDIVSLIRCKTPPYQSGEVKL